MATEYIQINPEVLKWARRSAGVTTEEAAKKAGVDEERYLIWEGEIPLEEEKQLPTMSKLRRLSNKFKRPLAQFFLKEPPPERKPLRDFRTVQAAAQPLSSSFQIQLRRALDRRDLALELMEDLEEQAEDFPLRTTMNEAPAEAARKIREALGVSVADQMGWAYGNHGDKAFNNWRTAIEKIGVLVFQFREVSRDEMRGASVPEFPLPIIIVNRKESQNARTFSLFHELVHLMLREGGICDNSDDQAIEVFCNRVAGEFLIPSDALLAHQVVIEHGEEKAWGDHELVTLARAFKVSEEAILRRLLILDRASRDFYRRKREDFLVRQPADGGPVMPDVDTLSKHGRKFTDLVLRGHEEGHVTYEDAASYLAVRSKYIPAIKTRLQKDLA